MKTTLKSFWCRSRKDLNILIKRVLFIVIWSLKISFFISKIKKNLNKVRSKYIKNFDPTIDKVKVLIGDLGFARSIKVNNCAESYCGTPLYIAPEIMNGK